MPARGEAGATVFVFGSTLPTIVCAPLFVCDLALEPGESVNDLNVGDNVRWRLRRQAKGRARAYYPCDYQADRCGAHHQSRAHHQPAHLHHQACVAREGLDAKSLVRLSGRDGGALEGLSGRAERVSEMAEAAKATAPRFIDDRYRVEGDNPPWRPLRVYTDGVKTIIQFPAGITFGDLPTLVALAEIRAFCISTVFGTAPPRRSSTTAS